MQSYVQSSNETHNQPLDFTSKKRNVESPILDLSCKKQELQKHHEHRNLQSLSSTFLDMSETNNFNNHQTHSPINSCGEERKSPIEVRTFMVTPPSESDSPKKPKLHSIYSKLNSSAVDVSSLYPRLAMNMPVPISPVLTNLLTGDGMSHIQMPVSLTSTSTSTSTLTTNTTSTPSNHNHDVATPLISPDISKKGPRPFKAYPKDPLSMSIGPAELVHDPTSNEAYNEFRKRMLESVRKTNDGTNIRMRRISKSPTLPTSTMDDKDAAYWERRRKNNEAAKRSRDARRAKEDEIAIRAAFLEQENMQLKCELVALRNETAKLRCMVFSN